MSTASTSSTARSDSLALSTTRWLSDEGKLRLFRINSEAEKEGFCYLRSLAYISALAVCDEPVFLYILLEIQNTLGKSPQVSTQLIPTLASLGKLAEKSLGQQALTYQSDPAKELGIASESYMKLKINTLGAEGTWHIEPTGYSWCDCDQSICQHGWADSMFFEIGSMSESLCGASGFDLQEFMDNFDAGESIYESTVQPPDLDLLKSQETKWQSMSLDQLREEANKPHEQRMEEARELAAKDEEMRKQAQCSFEETQNMADSRDNELSKPKDQIEKLELEKILRTSNFLPEEQPNPLRVRKIRPTGHNLPSVVPGDSVSNLGRSRLPSTMRELLVRSEVGESRTAYQKQENRLETRINDYLVQGFVETQSLNSLKEKHLSRILPVNGLPMPFRNARLNFLANFDTAVTRAFSQTPDKMQAFLLAYRNDSRVPSDSLLREVLKASIDWDSMQFISNPFNLPYIEIGMPVSEDSVTKMFSLTQDEYSVLWFQEMKSVRVPRFHSKFKGLKEEHGAILSDRRPPPSLASVSTAHSSHRKSRRESHSTASESVPSSRRSHSKARTFLGF